MKKRRPNRKSRLAGGMMLLVLTSLPCFPADFPPPLYEEIRPGIDYGRVQLTDPPIVFHVVRVDLRNQDLRVRAIRTVGKDETLEKLTGRLVKAGMPLLAAVNGDYFSSGKGDAFYPWGILVEDGEMIFSPTDKSAFVLDDQNRPRITLPGLTARVSFSEGSSGAEVLSVNRRLPTGGNECCLFTRVWGRAAPEYAAGFAVEVRGGGKLNRRLVRGKVTGLSRMPVRMPIPEDGFVLVFGSPSPPDSYRPQVGDPVTLELEALPPAREAIGGGPRLVRDGKISIEISEENFSRGKAAYLARGRHPRSGVGYNAARDQMLIVVAEGRSDRSRGMKMEELARLFHSLGAEDALAFDGGRSVGLFVGGREVVKGERIIYDALGVFSAGEKGK